MKTFLIKKTFFDIWDNFLCVVVLNLGFIIITTVISYVPFLIKNNITLLIIVLLFSFIFFNIFYGAVSLFTLKLSDYNSPGINDFYLIVKKSWRMSLLYSALLIMVLIIIIFIIPFYFGFQNYFGFFLSFSFIWLSLIFIFSVQYFYQIYGRLNNKFVQILTKCLVIFFDNIWFSILIAFGSVSIIVLSTITAFLFPGITGLTLWQSNGLKLRLHKYDYLKENPNVKSKNIPWDILLKKDKEIIGERTFKNTIFPWKH